MLAIRAPLPHALVPRRTEVIVAALLPMDSALPGQNLNFLAIFFHQCRAEASHAFSALPEVMLQLAVTKTRSCSDDLKATKAPTAL